MADITDINALPPPGLSVEDLPAPMAKAPPGALEATARGLEQGATLGFGPKINAGLSALLNQYTGKSTSPSLLDEYQKQRQESAANFKAAEEEYPILSGAANIAGGIAPALLTGGGSLEAEGLMGLAKTGAKIGGLAGLGGSEANDLAGTAKDVALGAAGGAITAPLFGAAGKALSGLTKLGGGAASAISDLPSLQEAKGQFQTGLQGIATTGKLALSAAKEGLTNASDEIADKLQNKYLNPLKLAKAQELNSEGPTVNGMLDWKNDAQKAMRNLYTSERSNPDLRDDITKLNNLIQERFSGVQAEEGNTFGAVPGKGTQPWTPAEADHFRAQLSQYGTALGDRSILKTEEGRALANALNVGKDLPEQQGYIQDLINLPDDFKSVKDQIYEARPNVVDMDQSMNSLLKAQEYLPSSSNLLRGESERISALQPQERIQRFLSQLPNEARNEFQGDISQISDYANKVAQANASGLGHGGIASIVASSGKGWMNSGANLAGRGANALYEATPDAMKQAASAIRSGGSAVHEQVANVLENAAGRDQVGRNALIYALQQNPAYREVLRTALPSGEIESEALPKGNSSHIDKTGGL